MASGLLCCCKVAEELILNRMDYTGSNLKIDGYYYHEYESGYIAHFFYRNGVIYTTNAMLNIDNLEDLDIQIINRLVKGKTAQFHWFWGTYKIEGDIIRINHWLPGTGGAYPAKLVKGKITDSVSLELNWGGDIINNKELNYWKFREFSPKPDSTNRFIK
jgi:hypothetical protein